MQPPNSKINSNMHFLNTARLFVNDLVSPIGFAVMRSEKKPLKWLKPVTLVHLGKYVIEVPTRNPITWQYSHRPDFIGQLGRLTSVLKKKYPDLAAIDIGANVGDTACIIKSAEDIPVLCIEGDASTFVYLQKNIRQLRNTTAHQLFLGEKTGEISVEIEKVGWNLTLKPGTGATAHSIMLTTLDDFLAAQPDQRSYKLLKIDTEGFDCSIIRGAKNYIQKNAPVITFEYNRGNMDAIGEPGLPTLFKLEESGYSRIVFHDQNGRFLLSTTLADHVLIKDLHDYADCERGQGGYLDVTIFHAKDTDLADAFLKAERSYRVQ
jgi:FkbM family methyltransferase